MKPNENTKEFKLDNLLPDEGSQTEIVEAINEINILEEKLDDLTDKMEVTETSEKKRKPNFFKRLVTGWKKLKTPAKIGIIAGLIILLSGSAFATYLLVNKDNAEKQDEPNINDDIAIKDNFKYNDGILTIYDSEDQVLGKYECQNKNESLCFVAFEMQDDNFNVPKKEFEEGSAVKIRTKVYENRYVFIFDNKEETDVVVILYDLKESREIASYLGVKSYKTDNDYVVIKDKENKYSLNEFSDNGIAKVFNDTFDYMGMIDSRGTPESVVVKKNNKYSILSFSGKTIVKDINYQIKDYTKDKILIVDSKNNYYIIDYLKEFVFSEKYKFIELLDEYAILIDDKNILKLMDYENSKYTEEGFKLNNDTFVRTNIYNENGAVVKTKEAYTYELNDDTFNLTVITGEDKTDYKVDLLEGKLSAKVNYYSYFDGKLYFYNDGEKKNLIGSYNCENKNTINAASEAFDKCLIASDINIDDNDMVTSLNVTSVTPIYNERFVFIRDAAALVSESAVKIKLYDLVDKKSLGSYVAINTYSTPDNIGVYMETITSSKLIIAKNKNGKYGAIKLTSKTVTSAIPFDYDSLERIGSYYLGKKDGKWTMVDEAGIKLTSEFNDQIRGYKGTYVKAKNNNRYRVYTFAAAGVGSDDFKYVELYDTVFAGVDDNNKLTVYNYTGTQLNNDAVQLEVSTYYGTDKKSFDVSVNASIITIKVFATDGTLKKNYNFDMNTGKEV